MVFHVDLAPHPKRETDAWGWLSNGERQRWRRFVYEGPARQFALCRAALRAVLCGELRCKNDELAFQFSKCGKSFALVRGERASMEFNVGHSGDHGLVAPSHQGRVGVDVEERRSRNNLDGVVETIFGPQEQTVLAGLQGKMWLDAFLAFWTIKEALAKALGMGLRTDYSRFQVPPEMLRGELTGTFRRPRLSKATWRLENIGSSDLAAAVAYEASPEATRLD